MIYAPILIPTLNRYEHLKRLIMSLQKNKWSKYTELYIGVDFPPSKKYVEGYKKICDYLKVEISGFKKVNIYYHQNNLGECDNIIFLKDEASKDYDRYILTEDDNEFSPNFLEYIDKGLDRFQDDETIIGICGYGYSVDWGLSQDSLLKIGCGYNAWGVGCWIKKSSKLFDELTLEYLSDLLCDIKRAWNLYKMSPLLFYFCVETVILKRGAMYDEHGKFQPVDLAKGIYMIDGGYFTINPVLSKVRNWGDDGSGLHGGEENIGKNQILDNREEFDFNTVQIYDDSQRIREKMKTYLTITCKSKYKLRVWLKPYRLKFTALSLGLIYWASNKFILKMK